MQRIAVIGGTGFLGQYLLPELLSKNEVEVCCLSRRKNGFGGLYNHNALEYVYCDYSEASLEKVLNGYDCLIYMGSSVPGKVSSENDFERDCIEAIRSAKTVFDVCTSLSIKNIVFTSSIAVYGNQGTEPYVETQKCLHTTYIKCLQTSGSIHIMFLIVFISGSNIRGNFYFFRYTFQ